MAGLFERVMNWAGIPVSRGEEPAAQPLQQDEYYYGEEEYEPAYEQAVNDFTDYDRTPLNESFRDQSQGRFGGGGYAGGSGRAATRNSVNNVTYLHQQKPPQYVLVSARPERLEEAQQICDHLKSRHVVIVNVEGLEGREAQRIVDFVGGAVYSLEGEIIDITNRIFAIAPSNVDLVAIQRDTKNRGFLASGRGNYRNQ